MKIKVKHFSLEKKEPRLLNEEIMTLPGKILMLRDADVIAVEVVADDKCTCGATKVPGTAWCFTCNPEYPR